LATLPLTEFARELLRRTFKVAGKTAHGRRVSPIRDLQLIVGGDSLPLAAGMQLMAEVIEDRRTVLEYLLSPVQRVVSEAGRER
jgi:multidrug efflux pump subunit AcrA (membrane-fusion protein)